MFIVITFFINYLLPFLVFCFHDFRKFCHRRTQMWGHHILILGHHRCHMEGHSSGWGHHSCQQGHHKTLQGHHRIQQEQHRIQQGHHILQKVPDSHRMERHILCWEQRILHHSHICSPSPSPSPWCGMFSCYTYSHMQERHILWIQEPRGRHSHQWGRRMGRCILLGLRMYHINNPTIKNM